jgi:tetratricopeptide (TPR) repeat protein
LPLIDRVNCPEVSLRLYLEYGQVLGKLARYREARETLIRAYSLAKRLGDLEASAQCCYTLGVIAALQADYDEADRQFALSLSLARALGNRWREAAALNGLDRFEESIEVNRELGNAHGIAVALGNIGIREFCQGNFSKAITCFTDSLAEFRMVGDRDGISRMLSDIGIALASTGRSDEALVYYQESLQLARETGNADQLNEVLHNIAEAKLRLRKYASAEELLKEAIEIAEDIESKDFLANHFNMLAEVLIVQGRDEEALQLAERGRKIKFEIGNTLGLPCSLYRVASVYIGRGQFNAASSLLREALKHTSATSHPDPNTLHSTCATLVTAGMLLAKANSFTASGVLCWGAIHDTEQRSLELLPLSQQHISDILAALETQLTPDASEELKIQAESMTLEELVDYALEALEELKAKLDSE